MAILFNSLKFNGGKSDSRAKMNKEQDFRMTKLKEAENSGRCIFSFNAAGLPRYGTYLLLNLAIFQQL
jgi:hypothetical protein